MKMNTLEKLYQCLKDLKPEITLDEELRVKAEAPIRKMLALSSNTAPTRVEYSWADEFRTLFDRCLEKYQSGNTDFESYYSDGDLDFLDSIGYKEREFFDFVEDFADYGDPSPETALLIASARRDYLYQKMSGKKSSRILRPEDLPLKTSEIDGLVWLPRILAKARGKLKGELDPEIMFSCGGDRQFLRTHDIAPADFLRTVWSAESADLANRRRARIDG